MLGVLTFLGPFGLSFQLLMVALQQMSYCSYLISDDAKVGQKLLEKMGWRKGKALGLNEDGCKEHIKVSTKSDRKGWLKACTSPCVHCNFCIKQLSINVACV